MKTWHLETRKLKDLLANPKNPRYIKKDMFEHLNSSIEKFGIIDKPIITKEGQIIGGHQRMNVLKKMKVKEVECWVPDDDTLFTQDELDELNIKLNKVSGEFDYEKLANEFNLTDLLDWGFTPEELIDTSLDDVVKEMKAQEEQEKEKKCQMCPSCGYEF